MSYYSPKEIVLQIEQVAQSKAQTSIAKTAVMAFLAGAYIALGGLLALVAAGGFPALAVGNPGIQKVLMGMFFPIGLMLTAIAGAELFTGNTAYFIPPVLCQKLRVSQMVKNWSVVYVGNFAGALFVAYFMAYLCGLLDGASWKELLMGIAESKTAAPFYKVFLKGVGANWLVALAMWMAYASKEIISKLVAIWVPVMAFVILGYEHSIANMFFIPTAMLYGADITVSQFLVQNLLPATLGNIAGGSILVGFVYWYLFGCKTEELK